MDMEQKRHHIARVIYATLQSADGCDRGMLSQQRDWERAKTAAANILLILE